MSVLYEDKSFDSLIEISMGGGPVKYERDEELNLMRINRVQSRHMIYPCNYGYIPKTLAEDEDPIDTLVLCNHPIIPGCIARCRAIGALNMEDESGIDPKIICVITKDNDYLGYESYEDVPEQLRKDIKHFFEHYKGTQSGKWCAVKGWLSMEESYDLIKDSIKRYEEQ